MVRACSRNSEHGATLVRAADTIIPRGYGSLSGIDSSLGVKAFHYGINGELLWEKDQAGNTKEYLWLNGRPLARVDNQTSLYYYHVDHLGTPQAMTDSTAKVVWKGDYEPFGKATMKVSTVENQQ